MLAINFYPLDCEELLSYTKQDYYWPRSSYLNYFEEPNIPPLKGELNVEENVVLEDYIKVKEQNIEIFEEINEGLVMEEDRKIKIIVEKKKWISYYREKSWSQDGRDHWGKNWRGKF